MVNDEDIYMHRMTTGTKQLLHRSLCRKFVEQKMLWDGIDQS